MGVLGLDLSLVGTGCIVIESNKVKLSRLITSKPSGKKPIDELKRLLGIVDKIRSIIIKNDIDLICIEGIAFMARNSGALSQLSGLNYLVRNIAYDDDVKFIIVPPTMLKKFVTGKGNCAKELMLLETYKRYGISFSDNNLCDAYGLAKIAEAIVEKKEKLTKPQTEVIEKIKYQYE